MMHWPLRILRKSSANLQITLPLALGAVLLIGALAQCMLLGVFLAGQNTPWSEQSNTVVLSYTQLQTQLASGNVAWVTLDNATSDIDGGLHHAVSGVSPQGKTILSDHIFVNYPYGGSAALRPQLQSQHVQILSAPPDSATNGPPALLIAALACGGFVLCGALGAGALFLGILRVMALRRGATGGV